ncbi:hypothetical protein X797_010810 [Metarhizium robertsii]|uniref:Uncharacterized protein n=1 Tax=Metarhizium robertsii TaxID=568076 RepID=A0A014N841_9HYPO|nr:hypothetical protein X797_010810 [Metarhizium robertsii]
MFQKNKYITPSRIGRQAMQQFNYRQPNRNCTRPPGLPKTNHGHRPRRYTTSASVLARHGKFHLLHPPPPFSHDTFQFPMLIGPGFTTPFPSLHGQGTPYRASHGKKATRASSAEPTPSIKPASPHRAHTPRVPTPALSKPPATQALANPYRCMTKPILS